MCVCVCVCVVGAGICCDNSFSDTVTWLFHLSSDASDKSLKVADYVRGSNQYKYLSYLQRNAKKWTVMMNLLSNTNTVIRNDVLQFFHYPQCSWCNICKGDLLNGENMHQRKPKLLQHCRSSWQKQVLVYIRGYRSLL